MKVVRDAATLLILILVLTSVRVSPAPDLDLPEAHAASPDGVSLAAPAATTTPAPCPARHPAADAGEAIPYELRVQRLPIDAAGTHVIRTVERDAQGQFVVLEIELDTAEIEVHTDSCPEAVAIRGKA